MKTFLKAWWRGIGALGHYLLASLALGLVNFLVESLPESLQIPVGVVVFMAFVPLMLFWIHRSCHPDSTVSKSNTSGAHQEAGQASIG